jgi:hypothetical protein
MLQVRKIELSANFSQRPVDASLIVTRDWEKEKSP